MPKISVIVPAYNAERFLNISIDSVIRGSFQDLEIIVVDDASDDDTYKIALEYAKKDSRIKVFTNKGGSAAATRNFALNKAKGEYVAFLDSDDSVDKDMYSEMYETAQSSGADLVLCDYKKVNGKSVKNFTHNIRAGLYNEQQKKDEYYNNLLIMQDDFEFPITVSNWLMLVKRDVIEKNNIRYDESNKHCEDELFGCLCAYYSKSIYYMKGKYFYNYNKFNENSVSSKKYYDDWEEFRGLVNNIKTVFSGFKDYDFTSQIALITLFFAMMSISSAKNNSFSVSYKLIKRIVKSDEVKWAFKNTKIPKNISKNQKIYFKLVKLKLALPTSLI